MYDPKNLKDFPQSDEWNNKFLKWALAALVVIAILIERFMP